MDQGRQGRDQVDTAVVQTFAANAVRLQLHALAYNPGNFLRTLATPEPIKDWSLTSLKEKLIHHLASVLLQGRKSANIHASSGVIWGMSGYTNFRGLEPAAA